MSTTRTPALLAGILVCVPAFWLAMDGRVRAQGRVPDQRGPIRVDVSLVNVIASVLDKDGRPAPEVSRDSFEIYEECKQQKVEIFEPETQQPLDLVLMMDASLSELEGITIPGRSRRAFHRAKSCVPGIAWRYFSLPTASRN